MSMEIKYLYTGSTPIKLKTFLTQQGISRRLLAKIKYAGGDLLVNGISHNVLVTLMPQTEVKIIFPPEKNRKEELIASYVPLDILYEDRDFLIVNKPAKVASIPSILHPADSLINRVYGYYKMRDYDDIIPHIVTRLDRDTSGLVLFAKHRYAHALLNEQLKNKQVIKKYLALVHGHVSYTQLDIKAPIARCADSTMKREVSPNGQFAHTSLKVKQIFADTTLLELQLHTGRTHQIRVHCAHLGYPLVGDDLYGGKIQMPIQRQALHCYKLIFYHPFKQQMLAFDAKLPSDMLSFLQHQS